MVYLDQKAITAILAILDREAHLVILAALVYLVLEVLVRKEIQACKAPWAPQVRPVQHWV